MEYKRIGHFGCDDGKTCPQVIRASGELWVQGYLPAEAPPVELPAGEGIVRVPREILLDAAWAEARRPIAEDEFDCLFQNFRESVFRLETLAEYSVVQEAERLAIFRETGDLPGRAIESNPWLAQIATSTRSGRKWSRVHVVTPPLSEYLEFELRSYRETAAAGFETFIAPTEGSPGLRHLTEDFWLFDADTDDPTVVLMKYDSAGRYLGADVSDNPETVARCVAQRDQALAQSVPLDRFLIRDRETRGAVGF